MIMKKILSLLAAFVLASTASFAATEVASIDESFARFGSPSIKDGAQFGQWANNATTNCVTVLKDWTNSTGTGYAWNGYINKYSGGANNVSQIGVGGTAPVGRLRMKWHAVGTQTRGITRFDTTSCPDIFNTTTSTSADVPTYFVNGSGANAGIQLVFTQNPHTEYDIQLAVLVHTTTPVEGWFQSSAKSMPLLTLADAPQTLTYNFAGAEAVTWQALDAASNTDMTVTNKAHADITLAGAANPDLSAIDGMGIIITDGPDKATRDAALTALGSPDATSSDSTMVFISNMILSSDLGGTVVIDPPATVTIGTTEGMAEIILDWNDVTGAATYNVYRSETSGSGYTKINAAPVSESTYTDTNVTVGTTYFYVVTTVDAGDVESANSDEVSIEAGAATTAVEDWLTY